MIHDLRVIWRIAAGRAAQPTATILHSRTVQSSAESGGRAGNDVAKRRRGSKDQVAVDTLGHLLALLVTPAHAEDRAQVAPLAEAVRAETGERVTLALYRSRRQPTTDPPPTPRRTGSRWRWMKIARRKIGCVLLHPPLGRGGQFRLDEAASGDWQGTTRRLPRTLAGLHLVAVTSLMLQQAFPPTDSS